MATRFEISKPGMRLRCAAMDERESTAMIPWDFLHLIAPETAASGG
jgi:hypothetical protein